MQLLALPGANQVVLSTAFMNGGGLALLAESLRPVADRTRIFVGIRNGITTAQGLQEALNLGCTVVAVDTGTSHQIFHPKVYCSRSTKEARIIIGSANLTVGGLISNIEASSLESMSLADKGSADFVDSVFHGLDRMTVEYPDNVFAVRDAVQIHELLEAGRIVDESSPRPPESVGISERRDLDQVPRMRLKVTPLPTTRDRRQNGMTTTGTAGTGPRSVGGLAKWRQELVWESNELSRRYLTIPTGENTNPTGSMLFHKRRT
ncbi:MAG: phospholipase D family protein [Trueperaceae bacterium]